MSNPISRRDFLRLLASGTAASVLQPGWNSQPGQTPVFSPRSTRLRPLDQPNILFILVDQLRAPQWFPDPQTLDGYLPSLARLRNGAVSFGQHYSAANACKPARSCLLTGLYAHQTACLLTWPGQTPNLETGFPTWGTELQTLGYRTYWFGKWHLSASSDLRSYGFTGPNFGHSYFPGLTKDPLYVDKFVQWFSAYASHGPWCTTVSLNNPHDIAYYYRYTDRTTGETDPPSVLTALPPNFETPGDLQARGKPSLQLSFQAAASDVMGALAFEGDGFETGWLKLLNLYLLLQQDVDVQIGRVLDTLEAQPDIADRTVVIFTSDHGEYAGSHGLRGKGCAVYDEAIRVPLYVKDYTGQYTADPETERTQLTSSVDLMPLLLTLASGDSAWRTDPHYAHLANRLDLTSLLLDPQAPGRSYVLHTSDEEFIEEDPEACHLWTFPHHVIGYRTAAAKLGLYSLWDGYDISEAGQESELYDYSTETGPQELDNVATTETDLYTELHDALVNDAIPNELRQPLPDYMLPAQDAAINRYLSCGMRRRNP